MVVVIARLVQLGTSRNFGGSASRGEMPVSSMSARYGERVSASIGAFLKNRAYGGCFPWMLKQVQHGAVGLETNYIENNRVQGSPLPAGGVLCPKEGTPL